MSAIQRVVSLFVAPGVLVTFVMTLVNLVYKQVEKNRQDAIEPTQAQDDIAKLLNQPAPAKTTVRQLMPKETLKAISSQNLLDKDIQFVAGESEMPLSVYESPIMNAYRKFRKMKKDDNTEGYYVVEKTTTHGNGKISNDTFFLYGRGPVFKMQDEYTDRFEGIDD